MKRLVQLVLVIVLVLFFFTPASAASFKYTDEDTGVVFTVPNGWQKGTVYSDAGGTTDALFQSEQNQYRIIVYGSYDAWNDLTPTQRVGMTRADYNNAFISKSDIAEWFGVDVAAVRMVTYNGYEYYKVKLSTVTGSNGISLDLETHILVRFENGYFYNFQIDAPKDSSYYNDFESLLSSVQYPAMSNSLSSPSPTPSAIQASSPTTSISPSQSSSREGPNLYWIPLVIIVIALLATIIGIVIKKRSRTQSGNSESSSEISPSAVDSIYAADPDSQQIPPSTYHQEHSSETIATPSSIIDLRDQNANPSFPPIRFCRKCGQKLPSDSGYCPYCGAEVVR